MPFVIEKILEELSMIRGKVIEKKKLVDTKTIDNEIILECKNGMGRVNGNITLTLNNNHVIASVTSGTIRIKSADIDGTYGQGYKKHLHPGDRIYSSNNGYHQLKIIV